MTSRPESRAKAKLCALALALAAIPATALATLGQDEPSAANDGAQLRAKHAVRPAAGYTITELRLPSGTTVREFISPDGKVFAVAWQGPSLPDLRQILGDDNFQRYTNRELSPRVSRSHRSLRQPDLVIHSSGRVRAFRGMAYVPALLPAGVTESDIR
jgi:hypothetical protein